MRGLVLRARAPASYLSTFYRAAMKEPYFEFICLATTV